MERRSLTNKMSNSPEFFRFCLVGVMNTGVDFAVFTLLSVGSIPLIAAQIVSYSCGVLNSFLMNRTWTFKRTDRSTIQFIRFVSLSLLTMAVTYGLMIEFHNQWQWPLLLSKFVATGLSLGINFVGSRLWVFSPNTP